MDQGWPAPSLDREKDAGARAPGVWATAGEPVQTARMPNLTGGRCGPGCSSPPGISRLSSQCCASWALSQLASPGLSQPARTPLGLQCRAMCVISRARVCRRLLRKETEPTVCHLREEAKVVSGHEVRPRNTEARGKQPRPRAPCTPTRGLGAHVDTGGSASCTEQLPEHLSLSHPQPYPAPPSSKSPEPASSHKELGTLRGSVPRGWKSEVTDV